ncbi:unnamed protein product [Amoebophrya sp. A25]|nr:unnamed protein product [Amoebophrya sp. A25]|eukprot:GSA25T00027871001.1
MMRCSTACVVSVPPIHADISHPLRMHAFLLHLPHRVPACCSTAAARTSSTPSEKTSLQLRLGKFAIEMSTSLPTIRKFRIQCGLDTTIQKNEFLSPKN